MNLRRKRFADLYIELGNATQAYLAAGFKATTQRAATANASRLLANPEVREYINARLAEKEAQRIARQDEILEFLTRVIRGEVTEQIPLLDGQGGQVLSRKELDARDRIKAAELLGKRYGLWVDRMDVDLSGVIQIVDDVPKKG